MLERPELTIGGLKRWVLRSMAVVTLAFAATAMVGTDAKAQVSAEAEQACTPDVFRLCNAFIPDRGRITACLRANRRALSAPCAGVFSPKKATRVAKAKRGKADRRRAKRRR